jgi:hypothetical protein
MEVEEWIWVRLERRSAEGTSLVVDQRLSVRGEANVKRKVSRGKEEGKGREKDEPSNGMYSIKRTVISLSLVSSTNAGISASLTPSGREPGQHD